MNAVELLEQLAAKGVELWVDGGRLRYRASRGVVTPKLLDQLREHKAELLELVASGATGRARAAERDGATYHPLSYGQQAQWFLYRSAPQSAAYNVAQPVRIRAPIDLKALRESFQAILQRHPILRTTFHLRDGRPVQQVHPGRDLCLQHVDASNWTWEATQKRVREAYRRPFDLEKGPVLRVHLFTRAADDHILLLVMHHIVCDGWSLSLLHDEFELLYPRARSGQPASLPPIQRSYTDHIRWQAETLNGPEGERLWGYWQRQLAGRLPVLNLPTDRPRPPVQSYRGATLHFKLKADLTERLREFSRAEEATLYMTLLAAFQVLLHRYSGQDDILVGSPTGGRTQPEFAGVLGYFVNPLVMRADLSKNPPFREFVGQVRQTVLAALEHQEYPFSLLVERLKPARDAGRTPIFQTSFVLQQPNHAGRIHDLLSHDGSGAPVDWGGLQLEPFPMDQQEGQFDVTLELVELPDAAHGEFRYNTDLFDCATIQRMRGHFENILEAVTTHPDGRVGTLPMLAPEERQRLLDQGSRPEVDGGQSLCVHQLFQRRAEQTPDAVAIVLEDEQYTYRELNERVNRLAHYLRTLGVGPEVRVGVCLERSPNLIAAILGVLKAGGAYVPLDPDYPKRRLAFMLQDSQTSVLLAQQDLLDALPEHQARVVCLDTQWEEIAGCSAADPACSTTLENLAYVIYTSGSTGRPKGVAVEHRGLSNLALTLATPEHFDVTADDRALQFSSISFDASVPEVFLAVCEGATLCLARRGDLLPGPGLIATLRRLGVTWVILPPSLLASMPAEELPELRTLIVAGESCPAEVVRRWSKGRRMVNGYGPTECTVCATLSECRGDEPRPSIGAPITNVWVYVLDPHGQPAPVGVPGELYIGGRGVARGYLNRPDLTAERFVPDPFSGRPGSRLYKTGDRCRWRPDGKLEFLERIDRQVKIHGFRIELGEVEAALTEHPQVQQSVVVARETGGGKDLVGYIVGNGRGTPSVGQLRSFLQAGLPRYMVPSAFVVLDRLPMTSSGKVDHKALPEPDGARPELEHPYTAPRSPEEKVLAEIWAEVLGVDRVGIHDNFFELGGASVKSLRIMAKAGEAGLSIDPALLTPELLFERPTIVELAELLDQPQAVDQP